MQNAKRWSGVLLAGALLMPQAAWAAEPQELPFGDIATHWAKAAIIRAAEAGLFSGGGGDKRFEPERRMTRGEFLALADRLLRSANQDLYPLTLMDEEEPDSWGEGFDEPYLPYKDVDRLTWLYPSALHLSVVMERLYGPGAIQRVFPGPWFRPGQPITRAEAAQLLQLLFTDENSPSAEAAMREYGWMKGALTGPLKRGEAAVIADRVKQYLDLHPVLPLLDADGSRFPAVPEISELFPLFAEIGDNPSAMEQRYMRAVEAISQGEDDENTYRELRQLVGTDFPVQMGVHYYLSWDPSTPMEQNLDEAFRALDAYVARNRQDPETLRLLAANVYDLSLQMADEQEGVFARTLARLSAYEPKFAKGSGEWQALGLYLGALEVRSGRIDQAIERYRSLAGTPEGLLNGLYYLIQRGHGDEARQLFQQAASLKDAEVPAAFRAALAKELSLLDHQDAARQELERALDGLDRLAGYRADGEAMLGSYVFKYRQDADNVRQTTHTTGFFKSPDKLIPQKLDMYADQKRGLTYNRQFDRNQWTVRKADRDDYIHEWVERLRPDARFKELGARYLLQSLGPYDVVTEWIPGDALVQKAQSVPLTSGRLKRAMIYVTKYYIQRDTGRLVRRVWRYEELYDSKEYAVYTGTESYSDFGRVRVDIPDDVTEGAVNES